MAHNNNSPRLGSAASVKLQDDDFRVHTEHRVRQAQIKRLVDSLQHSTVKKVAKIPSPPPPAVPTSSRHNKKHVPPDEERRRLILAKRRQEKLDQSVLREERELEDTANMQRLVRQREHDRRKQKMESRIETKKTADKKLAVAQQHSNRAHQLYRGWLPWTRRVKDVQLQNIKAKRHFHYCLIQNAWGCWMAAVQCCRVAKTQSTKRRISRMVSRLEFTLQREAWKRWHHHQLCLATLSRKVRGQVHFAVLSSCWEKWINSWIRRSRRQREIEQRASRRGEHAVKSRLFQAWKAETDSSRVKTILAEERCQIWKKVNLWLMPQIATSASSHQQALTLNW